MTWRLDGASTSPGNVLVTTRATGECSGAVSARRPSASCVVTWPALGDQWLTATYTSDPRPGGRLHTSATIEVDLRAPLDLGAGHRFDAYANTGPGAIEDCALAAAADWIEATYGVTPAPQAILASYWSAERGFHGGKDAGLSTAQLFSYWRDVGIAGTTLTGDVAVPLAEIGAYLARHHVLFATAALPAGFPGGLGRGGAHAWLVVGSSSSGPMLVTWGEEVQVSWADFDAWTTGVWAVTTTTPR